MTSYTPENPMPQAFRERIRSVLLHCVDGADTPSDAKAMILTMYESGFLSVAETFAYIQARGLQSA